jgi:hypothetical protein
MKQLSCRARSTGLTRVRFHYRRIPTSQSLSGTALSEQSRGRRRRHLGQGLGDRYLRSRVLVGIELLTIDARIVIASVDTYLRFAEALDRLDLTETERDLMEELA